MAECQTAKPLFAEFVNPSGHLPEAVDALPSGSQHCCPSSAWL
jgi:hypothetical protein